MNRSKENTLISVFLRNIPSILEKSLKETATHYRPYDPGLYLYKLLLKRPREEKFTDDFIEMVYTTLVAWNMNSRGAKLSDYKLFKKSILGSEELIRRISNKRMESLTNHEFEKVIVVLERLFEKLKLVASNKPPLVTFSKAMHFCLPDLVMPIDRKYTLTFFFNHCSIPSPNRQFEKYSNIQRQLFQFVTKIDLNCYLDNGWNTNIPKIVDNAIIGYMRKHKLNSTANG